MWSTVGLVRLVGWPLKPSSDKRKKLNGPLTEHDLLCTNGALAYAPKNFKQMSFKDKILKIKTRFSLVFFLVFKSIDLKVPFEYLCTIYQVHSDLVRDWRVRVSVMLQIFMLNPQLCLILIGIINERFTGSSFCFTGTVNGGSNFLVQLVEGFCAKPLGLWVFTLTKFN